MKTLEQKYEDARDQFFKSVREGYEPHEVDFYRRRFCRLSDTYRLSRNAKLFISNKLNNITENGN